MNNLRIFLTVVFTSILLGSCTSQTANSSNNNNLKREWMLLSFQHFSKDVLVKSQAKINLIPNEETPNQYSAKMGCNNLFFTAKMRSGNKIDFSQVGSTMMYCEGMMELESAFGKALPMMTTYQIDGHYLTLSDGKGHDMKFLAADWD